jgi:hypothetical protein
MVAWTGAKTLFRRLKVALLKVHFVAWMEGRFLQKKNLLVESERPNLKSI